MVVREDLGRFLQAVLPSNLLMERVRHLDWLKVKSDTTAAKGLSHEVHHQVHPLRHGRRRGSDPAPAGESATTALRLYGAVASAYHSTGVPALLRYEDDGKCRPRPPRSKPRPHSLRACQVGLCREVSPEGHGLRVDSSGR